MAACSTPAPIVSSTRPGMPLVISYPSRGAAQNDNAGSATKPRSLLITRCFILSSPSRGVRPASAPHLKQIVPQESFRARLEVLAATSIEINLLVGGRRQRLKCLGHL